MLIVFLLKGLTQKFSESGALMLDRVSYDITPERNLDYSLKTSMLLLIITCT